MKIAYFTDTYIPQLNGVATSVYHFAKSLRQSGQKVYIFAPKIRGYKDEDQDIFRIPSMRILPTLPDSVRIPLPVPHRTLLKILKLDCELIHAHGNGFFSLLGLAVARAKKIPYILTFHTQFGEYTHYFFNGKIIKPELANNLLLRRFGNICDGIIAPSQKMKDKLILSGVKKQIEVIPNFVDLEKFNHKKSDFLRSKFKIPKKSTILLSVGRLGKEKNFEFLLRVMAQLVKKNTTIYLAIVGEGFDMHKLKSSAQKLNIGKHVLLTGGIPTSLMPKVYASADLFVFASTSEVHPMVTIEAASSGLPLIVARDPAFEGIVNDGQNGYQLQLEEKVFAEKIIQLIKNPTLLRKFAKASKKLVEKNFDERLLRKKLLYFYQETIQGFRR